MGGAYAVHELLRLRSAIDLASSLGILECLLNQLTAQANTLSMSPKSLVIR